MPGQGFRLPPPSPGRRSPATTPPAPRPGRSDAGDRLPDSGRPARAPTHSQRQHREHHSMRSERALISASVVAIASATPRALADDDELKVKLAALERRVAEQDRRLAELDGRALDQDEVGAAGGATSRAHRAWHSWVGPTAEARASRWARSVHQGGQSNQLHVPRAGALRGLPLLGFAKGTLSDSGNPFSGAAPRDRTGFEDPTPLLRHRGHRLLRGHLVQDDPELRFRQRRARRGARGQYLDWRYADDHHVRAGADKVPFTYEDQQSSDVAGVRRSGDL